VTSRRLLLAGAVVTACGIAIAATAPVIGTAASGRIESQQAAGGVVVLVGWAALAWGIHRYGRERV